MIGGITIITVTARTGRAASVVEAIDCQTYAGWLEHLVVIDDNDAGWSEWRAFPDPWRKVIHCARSGRDVTGPKRLAFLRNLALLVAATEYVCFLDDDNSWEADHLSSLALLTDPPRTVCHSERFCVSSEGRPAAVTEFPWARDPAARGEIYQIYLQLGIFAEGSPVIADRAGMPYSCVDLGEWLLPRTPMLGVFAGDGQRSSWDRNIVEDHFIEQRLADLGVEIVSTRKPTLLYALGGYSNCHDGTGDLIWDRPEA